ncbi:hypothetical protein PPACK8108_LOCUS14579 [Phakopsora pachyrhizi]|uniref:Secreted protein n=1 Tax=Phakopsora pachyrhizi TaxID=170000 RepID=A0AAV0B7G2_PHAPC|nr:hypothetical protein PPACK8108_LOCUS14579 [Phakopsora pachyrhizi]
MIAVLQATLTLWGPSHRLLALAKYIWWGDKNFRHAGEKFPTFFFFLTSSTFQSLFFSTAHQKFKLFKAKHSHSPLSLKTYSTKGYSDTQTKV